PEDEPPPDRSRTGSRTRRRRDRALPRAERPAAHAPSVVASRRPPARTAERRAPARPPAARAPTEPAVRWRQLAVVALGAVDRPRADRGRVHREQPRRQQLFEG